jgi:hypothetical protein
MMNRMGSMMWGMGLDRLIVIVVLVRLRTSHVLHLTLLALDRHFQAG